MVDAVRERMTAAEFFELPETYKAAELINGEIIMSPGVVTAHLRVHRTLIYCMPSWIPDGEIFFAPYDVMLDEDNVPQPDLFWVSAARKNIIKGTHVEGAPDLIIEIASPGTVRRDRREKFDLYEKYGVHEYWLVDPVAAFIEVYYHENGKFQRLGVFGAGDSFDSKALGKMVTLNDVFPQDEA
jgi:Uma2 family endonuclease